MSHFSYQGNQLFCENVSVESIAQKQGTPLYIYSYQYLVEQYQELTTAFAKQDHLICYSMKANSNIAIVKTFVDSGAGADVVSAGELRRALAAGCPANKIVFSGVGKTSEDIHFAIDQGILQFNVESEQELHNIQRISAFLDKKANIAMRVNPDVDAKTHPHISTGLKENKFGVGHTKALELYELAQNMSHIEITGIDYHIGSQITEVGPFKAAAKKIKSLVQAIQKKGIALKYIDIGGGLGIDYGNNPTISAQEYADAILGELKDLKLTLILEPGRFLTGNSGIFVTKVVYLKKNDDGKHFTIVDGAFNDLMRPALYQAHHNIQPVVQIKDRPTVKTNITGPVCETTDFFAKDRGLPLTGPGEFLAILSTGAYGMSMASTYNSRPRPTEVLVKDKMFYVIRKPDRMEDITGRETLPEFLKDRS
jgi:diaminopimelate decarboxylase